MERGEVNTKLLTDIIGDIGRLSARIGSEYTPFSDKLTFMQIEELINEYSKKYNISVDVFKSNKIRDPFDFKVILLEEFGLYKEYYKK